jgi:hypothetical protein
MPAAAALGRSGLLKSPLQSSTRPILENYGCRWNESWIKVLYEAGGAPDVTDLHHVMDTHVARRAATSDQLQDVACQCGSVDDEPDSNRCGRFLHVVEDNTTICTICL